MITNDIIPSAGKTIITSAQNTSIAVNAIFLCNLSTTNNETINVYAVANGSTANNASIIIKDLVLNPTDTFVFNSEKLILENGDSLYAQSSSGNASCVLSTMNL